MKEVQNTARTYSNLGRDKGLTGGIYIKNVFKETRDRILEVWRWEKTNDFPGHCVNTELSGDDATARRLCQMLPKLELEYLQRLTNRWQYLINKLRLPSKDTFHKFIGHLDITLQCSLLDFETILNDEIRRYPRMNIESVKKPGYASMKS